MSGGDINEAGMHLDAAIARRDYVWACEPDDDCPDWDLDAAEAEAKLDYAKQEFLNIIREMGVDPKNLQRWMEA